MKLECGWCNAKNKIEGQVSGYKMGVICAECGTKLGFIGYKDLNEIIRERDYWKKKCLRDTCCDGI